jgi:hypothetical protein
MLAVKWVVSVEPAGSVKAVVSGEPINDCRDVNKDCVRHNEHSGAPCRSLLFWSAFVNSCHVPISPYSSSVKWGLEFDRDGGYGGYYLLLPSSVKRGMCVSTW